LVELIFQKIKFLNQKTIFFKFENLKTQHFFDWTRLKSFIGQRWTTKVKTIKKNRPRDSSAQTDRCILPKIGREIKTGEIVHLISNGDFSYLFAPQIEDLQDYEGNFKTPSGSAFEEQYRQCWDAKCKQIVKPNEKFTCKCRSEYHIKCEGCSEYLCSNTLKKHNEGKCPGLKFK
jgi:hypothetical protein